MTTQTIPEQYPERLAAIRVDPWYLPKCTYSIRVGSLESFLSEHKIKAVNDLTIFLEQ